MISRCSVTTFAIDADQQSAHSTIELCSFYLDGESTRSQLGSCRTRPVNADGSLEQTMLMHAVGGEGLPNLSYGVYLKLKLRKGLRCRNKELIPSTAK